MDCTSLIVTETISGTLNVCNNQVAAEMVKMLYVKMLSMSKMLLTLKGNPPDIVLVDARQ